MLGIITIAIIAGFCTNMIGRTLIKIIDVNSPLFFIKLRLAKLYDEKTFDYHIKIINAVRNDGSGRGYDDKIALYNTMFKEIINNNSKFKLYCCDYCLGMRLNILLLFIVFIYLIMTGQWVYFIIYFVISSAVYEFISML